MAENDIDYDFGDELFFLENIYSFLLFSNGF